jgi:hypothetical protein
MKLEEFPTKENALTLALVAPVEEASDAAILQDEDETQIIQASVIH